jgi:hypothetical protein
MSSTRYLSAPAVGIKETRTIGDLFDRTPHPLTACEIQEVTGQPYATVLGFLMKNDFNGRIRSQIIPRPGGGKP